MIIIPTLGHYFRKRRLGYVAEYCPRCCEARAVRFHEIVKYLTVWGIPLPPGVVVGHEIICEDCRAVFLVNPDRYGEPVKQKEPSIDRLIQQTFPGLWDELENREQLKNRVANRSASHAEKVAAVAEIISAYEGDAAVRSGQVNIEGWGTFTFVLMVLLPIATFIADARFSWPIGILGKLVLAQEVVLLTILIYFIATDARRYCHRKLLPRMLPALDQFQPTYIDIEAALGDLDRQGYIIGRKLDPNRVAEALNSFSKSMEMDRYK